MSNQPEQTNQPFQTSEELRQQLLAQIETSKQAMEGLSDEELEGLSEEELEGITGGGFWHFMKKAFHTGENVVSTGLDMFP